jgi:hypothetical protein
MVGANLTSRVETLTGSATLVTLGPQPAADLVGLAKQAIARLLDIPLIDLTPAANVLRSVQMEARGDRATFAGAIKVDTIIMLLGFLPKLEDMAPNLARARQAPTPTVEPLAPDAGDSGRPVSK